MLYYGRMLRRDAFMKRFWVWMVGYMVSITVATMAVPDPPRPDVLHITAAIVPRIFMLLALRETFLKVRAMDELQRRIHVEGLLLSLLGTIAIVLGVGLLQFIAGIPLFGVFWLWIPICLLYGLGVFFGKRRYA